MRISFLNFGFGMEATQGMWQMFWYPRRSRYPGTIARIAEFMQAKGIAVMGFAEVNFPEQRGVFRALTGMNVAGGVVYQSRFLRYLRQGNLLLTKYPIRNSVTLPLPGWGQPRAVLSADIETPDGIVLFLVTHLSLGKSSRRLQIAALADICRRATHPVALMGDFNVTNNEELAPLVKDGLMRRLSTGPTYPSWGPKKGLDHVFVSPTLAAGNASVFAAERFSDHLALIVDLTPSS